MLTRRYFRLQTLGRLTLTVVDGETESVAEIRPRHLAVLAVIALSTRPISRDALVEMFWGGEDESRARHSLSNALSGLRGVLGAEAITARRDTIALSEDARVEVDTVQFTSAYEAGDDARAVGVYGGRFLDAVHVPDAPEFDDWASRERGKLERRFVEVCERHVSQLQRGKATSGALAAAERWLDAAPTSSAAAAVVAKLKAEQRSSSDATSPAATTPILTDDDGDRRRVGAHSTTDDRPTSTLARRGWRDRRVARRRTRLASSVCVIRSIGRNATHRRRDVDRGRARRHVDRLASRGPPANDRHRSRRLARRGVRRAVARARRRRSTRRLGLGAAHRGQVDGRRTSTARQLVGDGWTLRRADGLRARRDGSQRLERLRVGDVHDSRREPCRAGTPSRESGRRHPRRRTGRHRAILGRRNCQRRRVPSFHARHALAER